MKLSINIPDYLTIEAYKKISSLEHLSPSEKIITTLSILSDIPEEKLRELHTLDLTNIFDDVTDRVVNVNPEFYPIIEVEGVMYGYCPITKLSLGANIDLESLSKDMNKNIEQIMGILYRPILKHRFNSFEYAFKQSFKVKTGSVENLTKYYELEPYSVELREKTAEVFKNLPISFAFGATSFFLQVGNSFIQGSKIYSDPNLKDPKKKEQLLKRKLEETSSRIGDGLELFITLRQLPSFQSQEIKLLQI